MKQIKKSLRGLTFTTDKENSIGTKFRYVIDVKEKKILIIQDKNGTGTVSRKKAGSRFKPLYDIRSKEVRELIADADYLEVTENGDNIVVYVCKKIKKTEKHLSKDIIKIQDILCLKTGEIVLSKASGESFSSYDTKTYAIAEDVLKNIISAEEIESETRKLETVYNVASLFSGAGLLDYAFIDPKFRFVYAVDFDKDAVITYRVNIGDHIVCMDIRDVDSDTIPDVDVVLGGACCQGYSNANRINQNTDAGRAKRLLVEDFIRLTKEKRPKVFCLENVPQILNREDGFYLNLILNGLSEYQITCKVIDDSEVGGYTKRKRAIIIGSLIGEIVLPDVKLEIKKTVYDALSKVDPSWFNYEDITNSSESTKAIMHLVPPGGNFRCIPESLHRFGPSTQSNTYRRLAWDEVSPTIINWRKCCMMPPEGDRILSVSEAAALMGLDKDFHILGSSISSRQQQVGNGVTQAIGKFIKHYILNALDAYSLSKKGIVYAQ